jgi:acetyl esterase
MRIGARAALSEPLVGLVGRGRRGATDADLDPQIAAVLELNRLLRLPALDSMEPAAARRFAEEGLSPLDVELAPMAKLIDTTIRGLAGRIPARIYVPHDAGPNWIVYLHGGGGVIGSIDSSDPVSRLLAAQTRCTVASIGYRLGPEERHPSAIDDVCSAWDAIVARVPPGGKIAVAGDSFGGFLSMHVDRHGRTTGARRPDLQVLIYPITDLTLTSPSIERLADGYLLTKSMVHWFLANYLHPQDDRHLPSPAHWSDLTGAAPAIVVTAGYDPLVDEGVAVRHRPYRSLIHGFLSMAGVVRAARTAVDEICDDIVEVLASG